jgi:imidazole glycerol phosphate synthase subunit HisF
MHLNIVVLGGLHIGGGIDENNAIHWLELGAEKVCLAEAASRHP